MISYTEKDQLLKLVSELKHHLVQLARDFPQTDKLLLKDTTTSIALIAADTLELYEPVFRLEEAIQHLEVDE